MKTILMLALMLTAVIATAQEKSTYTVYEVSYVEVSSKTEAFDYYKARALRMNWEDYLVTRKPVVKRFTRKADADAELVKVRGKRKGFRQRDIGNKLYQTIEADTMTVIAPEIVLDFSTSTVVISSDSEK